jgi:hypothetical protein
MKLVNPNIKRLSRTLREAAERSFQKNIFNENPPETLIEDIRGND